MTPRRSLILLLAGLTVLAVALAAWPRATPPGGPTASATAGTASPAVTGSAASEPASPHAPSAGAGPVDVSRIAITLERFIDVEGGPLAMTAPDDGSGRLFVAAQNGRIWVVQNGAVLPDPAVNLDDRVRSGGEQGLLGIAVHPDFPTDPRVFVNYTDEAGDTIVASLEVDPSDPNRFDRGSHERLLFVDQPFANHNGGATLFGPDGYLYVFLGDGGSGGDPQNNGQSRQELLGKALRIDVDGATGALGYGIPPDNPFVDDNGLDEIWHLGLRNPWRASFDRSTGDLWIGDVGQSSWEEIDVARAGTSGLNFGWNRMEGAHCFPPGDDCRGDAFTPPVSEYGRELGCTVIGGYVYRGSQYPALVGAYLFADYCSGRIFAIDSGATELVAPVEVGSSGGSIAAFGEDAGGELYVLSLDGEISRVVATER
jgi:glucose/arabinose dehydrogenase